MKPTILGGGGETFTGISWDVIKCDSASENGDFNLSILAGGDSLEIGGTSKDGSRGVTVVVGRKGVGTIEKYAQ